MAPLLQPRPILPAARRAPPRYHRRKTCFYDLPAELRIEIYKLALESVTIHILPTPTPTPTPSPAPAPASAAATTTRFTPANQPNPANHSTPANTANTTNQSGNTTPPFRAPHALIRTSHQIRLEVLPLIHNSCPITASITDFDFTGLLTWMRRMPPDQESNLCKNPSLTIKLCTTTNAKKDKTSNSSRNSSSLKRWLHIRADVHRPQPKWRYMGSVPDGKTSSDLKRKVKRAAVPGEKRELGCMLKAIGVPVAVETETAGSGEGSES